MDFLFFYHPLWKNAVSQVGYRTHEESAKGLLEHARDIIREKGMDSPEYAYVLGLICHFSLDSECHPFVAAEIERTGVGHIEIESELEKYLMRKDGENPLAYPVGKTFPTDHETAEVMAQFYEGITAKYAEKSLKAMRMYKCILTAPRPFKRTALMLGMRLSGQYELLQGHLLHPKDNPKCRESVLGLAARLENAVDVAEKLIEEFTESVECGTELGERFDRNFE